MSTKHTLWKTLSCDLTGEEVNTYSQELASVTTEQAEIEAEKKDILSSFTARLNKCAADRIVLARKITTKKEDRQVECDLDFDYAKGMVYTVRTDTGVTIAQRKLSEDERQQWLDLDAEEGRRQEAEDRRNETAAAGTAGNVIEGEILQIEHKPAEDTDTEISVCSNTECSHYDADEPNGCAECENVYECDQCKPTGTAAETSEECSRCQVAGCGNCCRDCKNICNNQQICLVEEAEEEKKQAELAEFARRDSICKEWRFCDHKGICFMPENEINGTCFKDEPHLIPLTELQEKSIRRLTGTSANDCKISLTHEYDMRVLLASLEIVTERGAKTQAKFISARINQLEKTEVAP